MSEHTRPLVLLVDGLATDRIAIREQIVQEYRVADAPTIEAAIQTLITSGEVNLLLTNHQLPDGSGLRMLDETQGYWPPIPVIFMIDPGGEGAAATALQRGAADYFVKGGTELLRLSRILANALARSRAEVAAQRRAREMGVLNVLLTALNREMDEEPVLDTVVHEVKALMGTDACSIFLMQAGSDQMILRASTRLPVRDMVWPVPASKSIAGRVFRERKGCLTRDVTLDPDWYPLDVGHLISTPVRSMLTVPLLTGNRAIGVLQAINKSVGPFLPSDLSLMEAIAAIATAAIVRGHQFAAMQSALEQAAPAVNPRKTIPG